MNEIITEKKADDKVQEDNYENMDFKEIEVTEDKYYKTKKAMFITSFFISFVFIVFLLSIIFSVINFNNKKILSNIFIDEVNVQNLTIEEAREKVNAAINKKMQQVIKLKCDDIEKEVKIEDLKVTYSIEKNLESAYKIGRDGNIFENNYRIFLTMIDKTKIESDLSFDSIVLENVLKEIQNEIPNHIVEYSFSVDDDKLYIYKGVDGEKLDSERVYNLIKENLLDLNEKIEDIKISHKKQKAEDIDVEKIQKEVYTEPKNAYFTKEPYEVHKHVDGVDFAISIDEAKKIINEDKEEYVIPLKITPPEITVKQIGREAFPDILATYSTKYNAGKVNRSNNITISANAINDYVLMPGEIFSYNKVVGKRTSERGYKSAPSYVGGEVVDSVGGGICQVSSTLYNSVLLSNLEVVERYNHCFTPDYVPVCRDATVAWGGCDFKFKNNRDYPIRIVSYGSGGTVKVDIIGVKRSTDYTVEIESYVTGYIGPSVVYKPTNTLVSGETKVSSNGSNGCYAVGYKILKQNGTVISKTLISKDRYNAHNKVVLIGE